MLIRAQLFPIAADTNQALYNNNVNIFCIYLMDVNVINAFLVAAYDVLKKELDLAAEKGPISLTEGFVNIPDFTIRIDVTGETQGTIWYCMDNETACSIASRMMDSTITTLDDMAESALGELGNMISGAAAMQLEKVSIPCTPTSPVIMKGKRPCLLEGTSALSIPLTTPLGSMDIKVSIHRAAGAGMLA